MRLPSCLSPRLVPSVRNAATPLVPLCYPLPAPSPSLFSPSRPAYNRGRFESGSRWMRGTSRESGAAGGEAEEGRGEKRGQEGEAERARSEREGQKSGGGQWEEVPEPRERQEPTTSLELEFLFIARAPRGGEPHTYLLLLLLRGSISIGTNSSNIIGTPTVTSAATATSSVNHLRRLSTPAILELLSPDSLTRDG